MTVKTKHTEGHGAATVSGWTFEREPDGAVTIEFEDELHSVRGTTLSADEWADVVATVSLGSEGDKKRRKQALLVHNGRGRIEIQMNGEAVARAMLEQIEVLALPTHPEGLVIPTAADRAAHG